MSNNQIAKATIYLDTKQAESELKGLAAKVDVYAQKMNKARKANDKAGFDRAKKDYQAANKEMKSYKKTVVDVTAVLNNLNGTSLKNLSATQRKLQNEVTRMNRTTKEEIALYNKKVTQLKLVKAQTTKLRLEMNNANMATKSWMSNLANGFNKYSMIIMSAAASILGIVMVMRKAVDAANDYESSLANLSALTGLTGDNLNWLSKQALDLSGSVDEAGIRISTSAKDILEAYTQMGSKRPELLKDKEALASVTKQAIILSQAAKMELVPATNSLAISMNQFNASAEEAPRYINAIAAGSKVGAGNVLYIAEALENAGTSANGANLSVETTIGLIETLAPKFSKASRAGINLRNILTRLTTGADEYNPTIVGMEQALNNLADANLSVNTITEMFTIRNKDAIITLIENRKEFVNYRNAVTDSNIAVEQAITNTATNAAKLEGARARLNKIAILLGQKLAPALTFSTNAASYTLKALLALSNIFKEYKIAIVTTVSAIVAWTVVTKLQAKWDAIHYGYLVAKNAITKAYALTVWTVTDATKMAAFWQKAWNWAIKANPIGMLVTVVAAAATAIYLYSQRTEEAAKQQIILNEAAKEGVEIWKDTKPLEERAAVIDKMNKKQLESFKSDALLQLAQIEKLNELKLIAQNNYDNEIEALRVMKSRKYTYGELLRYQNDADKAKEHLDHMTKLVKESNAEQLQSYVDTANELINVSSKGNNQFTSIKELKEEINRLVEAKDLLDIADKKAIEQAQQNIDAKKAELKVYEDLGKASNSVATLDEFIKNNAEEFENWKLAREKYLLDQAEWEDEEKRRIKEMMDAAAEAEAEEFSFEEDENIEDSPELQKAMNLALAELSIYQDSYEGRLEALNKMHEAGIITEEQYQERLFELNQEVLNEKLAKYYNYIGAISQATAAYSTFMNAQMNKELKAAGDNELEKEKIQVRYAKKQQVIDSAQAAMRGAMAVMNLWGNNTLPYPAAAVFNGIMTGVIAATTMAQISEINSAQFADGNYMNVIGADDGKKYNAKIGNNQSRLVTQPTYEPGLGLVAEDVPELVFSGADTQKIINTPELIDAINYTIGAKQFSEGNSTEIIKETNTVTETFTDPAMLEMLTKINDRLEQPSKSYLVADEDYIIIHNEKLNEYTKFQNKVN